MKIHQGAVLSRDPEYDMEAATKRYVDIQIGGVATGAGLFITDVTSNGGIAGSKQYVSGTVPANKVLTEATSDTASVRVHFFAEGGASFYSPTIAVDTDPGPGVPGIITETSTDYRTYNGYADITVADGLEEGRLVTVTTDVGGGFTTVLIKRAPMPPVISAMTFGTTYPNDPYTGSPQTTLKAGDLMTVTGTVQNSATQVDLISSFGAVGSGTFTTATAGGSLGANDSGGVGYKTFTIRFSVSNLSGLQSAKAEAKNSFGTYGPEFTTTNQVTLDQAAPVIGTFTVTYPGTQTALKDSEQATVSSTVTGYTAVVYSTDANNFISIPSPTTYAASKTVTRIGGNYVYDGNNYIITAYKSSNGTSSTANTDVNISNVAPTVAITGASTRLISSPTGQAYQITMTFNQRLKSAPSIVSSGDPTAGDRGTIAMVSSNPTTWRFTLTVDDADVKGTYNWTVNNVTTLSENVYNGVTISSGGSYTLGGFTSRTVTVGALEQVVDIGTEITDPTKTTVRYAGTLQDLTYRGATLTQYFQGWSTVDGSALTYTVGTEPFQNYTNFVFDATSKWLFITDADFAGANTTGTLQVTIVEVA